MGRLQVALYVPNLLCYARILLTFVGQYYAHAEKPITAIVVWVFSASLDMLDGWAARTLHQTSKLGIVLDVIADNVLRTCVWLAVAQVSSGLQYVALGIISLEWTTLLATQLHAAQNGKHWKEVRGQDPWLVREFFSSNFCNPLGTWGVVGLFGANLFLYGMHFESIRGSVPGFYSLLVVACCGRFLSMLIELWLCCSYLVYLIDEDNLEIKDES